MERLTYDEFKEIFRSSKRAWHLEQKDTYNVRSEDEPFRRFCDGEPDDYEWLSEWHGLIHEMTQSGIAVERLRVVTVPHTDYTRWGFAVAPHSIRAGEEIRYITRDLVDDVVFPDDDCWLFDDTLVLSVFSEGGRVGGFARTTDRQLAAAYQVIRDQVWPKAVPYAQYVPSTP